MILCIRTRIIYDFLVIIQGSYMISLVSYKDRTKKPSMDSMKSYMILVSKSKKLQPGCFIQMRRALILLYKNTRHRIFTNFISGTRFIQNWDLGAPILPIGTFTTDLAEKFIKHISTTSDLQSNELNKIKN